MKSVLESGRGRFVALVLFIMLVFLMGGGARDDIQSLVILRPLSCLFAAYALILIQRSELKDLGLPFWLLLALGLLMIVQLVPLPPAIWSSLPQRDIYFEIAELANIPQPWRPITASPAETLNSLFSLIVPLAAMLLFAIQKSGYHRKTIVAVFILVLASALWGFLQLMGADNGPLYLYQVTNNGSPVGFFANRNHQAVLLAFAIIVAGWIGLGRLTSENALSRLALASILLIVPIILVTGSRAGIGLAFLAVVYFIFAVIRQYWLSRKSSNMNPADHARMKRNIYIVGAALAGVTLVVLWAIMQSRSMALDRLFGVDVGSDRRALVLPALFAMARDYLPFGSGFGSFEHVFRAYETPELLRPTYLNQAHNDWMQFLIEGGVAAAVILAVFIFWMVRATLRYWKTDDAKRSMSFEIHLMFILFMALASMVDYPLRVPSIMVVFAFSCAAIARSQARGSRLPPRTSDSAQ